MVVSYTRLYHVFCDVVTLVWAARKRRRILSAVFYPVMAVSARAGSFGFPIMGGGRVHDREARHLVLRQLEVKQAEILPDALRMDGLGKAPGKSRGLISSGGAPFHALLRKSPAAPCGGSAL